MAGLSAGSRAAPVLVDSSITIALLDSDDALHAPARAAVEASRDRVLVASVLTYAETLVAPLVRGAAARELAEDFFREVVHRLEPVSASIARRGAHLRARHPALGLPDALILATGEELDVERILTGDARWPSLSDRVDLVAG